MATSVGLDPEKVYPASAYVARKLLERCSGSGRTTESPEAGKNLLLFVHGYNNDMTDVLNRAEKLEMNYGVEVVFFSWPANGGGLHGVVATSATSATTGFHRCVGSGA